MRLYKVGVSIRAGLLLCPRVFDPICPELRDSGLQGSGLAYSKHFRGRLCGILLMLSNLDLPPWRTKEEGLYSADEMFGFPLIRL